MAIALPEPAVVPEWGHLLLGPDGEKIRVPYFAFAKLRRREEMDPFSIEDLKKIETKFRERFPKTLAFFLLLSRTGLRIGEGIALQWRDIDWDKSEIIVRRNLPQHRHLELKKTRASERRVDMIPRLAEELKLWHKQRTPAPLKAGRPLKAEDWIWTTAEGTPLRYSNFVRRVWNRVQDLAEVRQRSPHNLRGYVSKVLQKGIREE